MDIYAALAELDKLGLPKDKCVIVSSGALAIRGLREAYDLDVLVTEDLWNELKTKYKLTKTHPVENIELGDIQLMHTGSWYLNPELTNIDEIFDTADEINGHKFASLEIIKKVKKHEGREKDLRDVELIEEYLGKNAG